MAKSKYDEIVKPKLKKVKEWVTQGCTDEMVAHNLGISKVTLYKYMKEHPELSTLLKRAKEVVDIQVENALLKRALGYEAEEVTTGPQGVVIKRIVKHIPPDTTAQIFWLKNRKPDDWRDKREVVGDMDQTITFAVRDEMKESAE